MLHLRDLGLLRLQARTVHNRELGDLLDEWERSERRKRVRQRLFEADDIDPDEVIMPPHRAAERGLTSTVTFPKGNLAPEGSVVKSTSIDPSVIDGDGVYRKTSPARVFASERSAIAAIKGQTENPVRPGDILVLAGRGPLGSGMEETYQLTAALRYLDWGKEVALITDARFSGISTGACIGHVGPEALAGGPIGRVREGDLIRIVIDTVNLEGSIDVVGVDGRIFTAEEGAAFLASRPPNPDIMPDPRLPDDTRLWAMLQSVSGGTWSGCVYDVERIIQTLEAGQRALANS
jgi:xylonate dehydratase